MVTTAATETTLQRESRELRSVFVRAVDPSGELIDLTAFPVDVGWGPLFGRPTTWYPANWVDGGPFDSDIGLAWQAVVEVGGPDSGAAAELAIGNHREYVRINTGTELPVLLVGFLEVI